VRHYNRPEDEVKEGSRTLHARDGRSFINAVAAHTGTCELTTDLDTQRSKDDTRVRCRNACAIA